MTQTQAQSDTVPIESLDAFVKALSYWHTNGVAMVKHMMDIPPGTEVVPFQEGSDEPSGDPVVLDGDVLKGFVIGLSVALAELGSLPFEAEMEYDTKNGGQPIH